MALRGKVLRSVACVAAMAVVLFAGVPAGAQAPRPVAFVAVIACRTVSSDAVTS